MSNQISYRQGDVLLIRVEDKDELNDVDSTVLAEGKPPAINMKLSMAPSIPASGILTKICPFYRRNHPCSP